MSEKPQQEEPGAYEKNKRSSVYIYLVILFGAAFLMLLLAYFIQQRNNEIAMDDLRDSVSRFQSIDDLREENAALKAEVERLEGRLSDAEKNLAASQDANTTLEDTLASYNDSLHLEQLSREIALRCQAIRLYFQYKDYNPCVDELLDVFGHDGYEIETLSYVSGRIYAGNCLQIAQELVGMGYLDEDDIDLERLTAISGPSPADGTESSE